MKFSLFSVVLAVASTFPSAVQGQGPNLRSSTAVIQEEGHRDLQQCENLIINGSFESASIDPGSFVTINAGSFQLSSPLPIDNWNEIRGSSIDYIGTYWPASDGERSIDLNGMGAGTIFQTVETLPRTRYIVVFDMAPNPDNGTNKKMQVTAEAQGKYFYTFHLGWKEETFTFTSENRQTSVFFKGDEKDDFWGVALDNVRMYTEACYLQNLND